MDRIKLGDYNRLKVVKKVDFGMYLDGGVEGEILLPSRYVPEGCKVGDELDVFIYIDQNEKNAFYKYKFYFKHNNSSLMENALY